MNLFRAAKSIFHVHKKGSTDATSVTTKQSYDMKWLNEQYSLEEQCEILNLAIKSLKAIPRSALADIYPIAIDELSAYRDAFSFPMIVLVNYSDLKDAEKLASNLFYFYENWELASKQTSFPQGTEYANSCLRRLPAFVHKGIYPLGRNESFGGPLVPEIEKLRDEIQEKIKANGDSRSQQDRTEE